MNGEARPSYLEIGTHIQHVRIARNVSTKQLADALHIRERYILALEAGDMELLPGMVYARGYIERILQFLDAEAGDVLKEFDAVTDEPSRKLFHLNMHWGDSPHPTPQFALLCATLALIILLAWQALHPNRTASLVDVYTPEPERSNFTPTRCTQDSKWPCFWENLELWYIRNTQKHWK